MSTESGAHPGQPGRGTEGAPSLAAVPFLERKLDDLYDALGDARPADILFKAKISLQAGDYSTALQLVEGVTQWCTSLGNRPKAAAARLRGKAARCFSADVLSGLDLVLRLLQPLGDWHRQQLEADGMASADEAAAAWSSRDEADTPVQEGLDGFLDARQYLNPLLDRRVFHQLFMAARQCELVPNPDVIMAVRDREVADGRYQKAYEILEAMHCQFNALAGQRVEDLRREEIQYKAGKIKMSVKEWLARQRRVSEQSQYIDRTRRYFSRVLDALRAIRQSKPG